MNIRLAPALSGQIARFDGLACYVGGMGPPLLLVHSVNAAASSAEMRTLYEHYRHDHSVFALDLPGFGLSERKDCDYTPRLMTDALHRTVALMRRSCGSQPVDAVALSLGCEFLARAACEAPAHFARLAFISPTGLDGQKSLRGAAGSTREVPGLHALLSQPLWAKALYGQLTRPAVVRYFLEKTFGSKQIDETAWAYAVATARQPGAHHAPLHFLARKLFSADIHRVYDTLPQPVWMGCGVRGDFADFRGLARVPGAARWSRSMFNTGAMPHLEVPQAFCRALDSYLDDDYNREPPSARKPSAPVRGSWVPLDAK